MLGGCTAGTALTQTGLEAYAFSWMCSLPMCGKAHSCGTGS